MNETASDQPQEEDPFAPARRNMIREQLAARGIASEAVLRAFMDVPRHLFVPPDLWQYAYDDQPLPIGQYQTISQPYMVAVMTELLSLSPNDHVLEIGVGSGYQTAILAQLVGSIIGVERLPTLAQQAQDRLRSFGLA
ncbi:MAG: protein-L-isoaspartate O-methyltransferase, partial [Chloroflexi bacterium]|nr:protein-L-isoaspartate O-methyltransferase [Chloroflexota bacterium]